jgi:hypothetical protein
MMRFLLGLATFSSACVFGAPVGCPAAPGLIKEGFFISPNAPVNVRAGYEGDFVADARLQQSGPGQGRVDNFNQQTNAGTITLNGVNRVDLFGLCGSSRACTDWRFTVDDVTHRAEVVTLYNFLWGAGTRAIVYKTCAASLGVGGRYEECQYDNLWLTIDGTEHSGANTFLHWRVWQVDFDFGYQIDIFTPYIGIKYSNIRVKIGDFDEPVSNDGSGSDQFKNRTPVGVFIGCSLSSGKYFMLNVEGRLIDEEGVTISGDFKF